MNADEFFTNLTLLGFLDHDSSVHLISCSLGDCVVYAGNNLYTNIYINGYVRFGGTGNFEKALEFIVNHLKESKS